jgi:hypothetical protein
LESLNPIEINTGSDRERDRSQRIQAWRNGSLQLHWGFFLFEEFLSFVLCGRPGGFFSIISKRVDRYEARKDTSSNTRSPFSFSFDVAAQFSQNSDQVGHVSFAFFNLVGSISTG